MFTCVVDENWMGPTIIEIGPILSDMEDPVHVRWNNTTQERLFYTRNKTREFVLHVQSETECARTSSTLGGSYILDKKDFERARAALIQKTGPEWRALVEELGQTRALAVLSATVASSIKSGKRPTVTCSVVSSVVLEGVHPQDADVLMRIRSKGTGR